MPTTPDRPAESILGPITPIRCTEPGCHWACHGVPDKYADSRARIVREHLAAEHAPTPKSPDRPADQLRAAAEKLRAEAARAHRASPAPWTVTDEHVVRCADGMTVADRSSTDHPAERADLPYIALMHPGIANPVAWWLEWQAAVLADGHTAALDPALAVARQLLGTTACPECGTSGACNGGPCPLLGATSEDAPPLSVEGRTNAELASLAVNAANALRDERRHYRIACEENARLRAELAAAPPAPADRAAEVKAATTIKRLRAERAELNRQLDCLRGDVRDMETSLREQDAEFERIRRAPGGAQPARRRLTPNEHDRAWHAIEGSAGEEGADPGTVLNAVLHALRIDPPTAAEEQAASPLRRLAGEAAASPSLAARFEALAAEWEKRGEYGDSSITDRARELRAVLAAVPAAPEEQAR
ncbi:hypothetical protein ABZ609_00345 [Streptomyces rubiginosohelvolus]|uniref:hypothetical protein n=1 Tax=Streptomyces rubiginosohelvolus TaxID=67362 RepID=UPI0033FBA691